MYHCQIIRSTDDLAQTIAPWKEFLGHAGEKQFYQDPEKIFLQYKDGADKDSLRIIVVRKDGRIQAIAPFVIQPQKYCLKLGIIKLFPYNVRLLSLLGSAVATRHDVEAGDILPFILERVRALIAEEKLDGAYFPVIPCDKELYGFLRGAQCRRLRFRAVNCDIHAEKNWTVPVAGDFQGYISSLRSENRRRLSKSYKKTAGQSRCALVERPEQVKGFLEIAETIRKKSWQGRTFGYSLRYGDRTFLEHIAKKGWLRSYVLFYNEEPAAFGLCFNYGRRLYCEECGYDMQFADTTPGYVLLYYILEDLFRSGSVDLLDFGYGDNSYKHVFAREYFPSASLYLAQETAFFRFVLLCQVALRYAYLGLRRISGLLKVEAFARSIVKRKTVSLRLPAGQQQ